MDDTVSYQDQPVVDLKPINTGTPLHEWFSCCLPKKQQHASEPQRKLVKEFKHDLENEPNLPASSLIKEKLLSKVTEETQSGILREYSATDIPDLQRTEGSNSECAADEFYPAVEEEQQQPAVAAAMSSNKKKGGLATEFWKMVLSVLFLTWAGNAPQKKRLKADPLAPSKDENVEWIND